MVRFILKPSIFCFLATLIVYILQIIPYTGIFLMFYAAALWSVYTINAGFLFMIAEALWWKLSPRWTILIPLIYFGGYFIFATISNIRVSAADQVPIVRIPFDPNKQVLSVPSDFAQTLLVKYGLKEVLSSHPIDYGAEEYGLAKRETIVRIGDKEQCEAMRGYGYHKHTFYMMINISDGKGGHKRVPDKCIYGIPLANEPLNKEIIMIEQKKERRKSSDKRLIDDQPISITTSEGKISVLPAAEGTLYPLFPLPILGCGLNSALAKWECIASFSAYPHKRRLGYGQMDKLATSLGLIKQDEDAILSRKTSEIQINRIVEQYNDPKSKFERIIANPCGAQLPDRDFPIILEDRAYVSSVKDKIMDAYIRATKDYLICEAENRELRTALTPFIIGLSDEDYKSLSEKLNAYFLTDGADFQNRNYSLRIHYGNKSDTLMLIRFGDLGEDAYDTLLKLLKTSLQQPGSARLSWNAPTALYYAICRAGPGISKQARPLLKVALNSYKKQLNGNGDSKYMREALYAAFMRLGLKKDYYAYMSRSDELKRIEAKISPNSPPDACFDLNAKL